MTRMFGLMAAGMVAVLALMAGQASAQGEDQDYFAETDETQTTAVSASAYDYSAVQAELAALRERVGELKYAGGDRGGRVDGGGCDYWCDCCSGAFGGVEAAILVPVFEDGVSTLRYSSQMGVAPGGPPMQIGNDWDAQVTPRFWFGYQNGNCRGIRFRYWEFDHTSNVNNVNLDFRINQPNVPVTSTAGLNFIAADAELFQKVCWGPLNMTLSGGVRWAKARMNRAYVAANGFALAAETDFEGAGPTIGIESRIPLGCSERLAFVSNARGSLVFGDTSKLFQGANPGLAFADAFDEEFDMIYILEMQLGLEYSRETRYGRAFVRGMFEGQYWGNAGFDQDDILTPALLGTPGPGNSGGFGGLLFKQDDSVGFVGGTIAIGIER
jgi:hypothetical protein